ITPYKDFYEKLLNIIINGNEVDYQKNDLKLSNAKFITWFAPIISALKELNNTGTPNQVKDIILTYIEKDKTSGINSMLEFNSKDIDFARLYLRFAGIIDGNEHGVWKLTEYGTNVIMTDELASYILKNRDKLQDIDMQNELQKYSSSNYWWLNANPNEWSFSNIEVGQSIDFTSSNENGNKRQIYKNFEDAKVGDIVIGYESGSTKAIVAICKISKEHDGERLWFEKVKNLVIPIKWQDLIEIEEFKNKKFQGTLFKLSQEEYNAIVDLIANEYRNIDAPFPYSEEDFLNEVFIAPDQYNEIKFLLKNKKNIILQGAPGVGKTFAAKRLACSLMGCKDNSRIEMVQFHQNYSYEDFVMGYRPVDGGSFELRNGCFHNFCMKASNDPGNEYYFIIDEINRGNLSKIFGELLMLIECDKRGISNAVPLTYKPDTRFYVPENVHIIGMMNTADRSLAMIDYALRRRFCFIEMEPAFQSKQFEEHLKSKNFDIALINKIITQSSHIT
ncbi:MAG: AAA family ATPase, partial [bacterium]